MLLDLLSIYDYINIVRYLKNKKREMDSIPKNRLLKLLTTLFYYFSILIFFVAFNFKDNPGGWQLQIIPNLNGTTIQDVTFTDSLTGYLSTGLNNQLGYIFKTTNGGVNWNIKKTSSYNFQRIIFCDKFIGYCNSYDTLFKTTDGGENWYSIPFPNGIFGDDMFALNKDTLWIAMNDRLTGGVFRSTNGGLNWIQQFYNFYTGNPDKIYMVNKNLGFMGRDYNDYFGRTTNGGFNWTITNGDTSFYDMHFIDSLTGWKASGANIKKTTNGGLNWTWQILPQLNFINIMIKFSFVNKDTIFGVGGVIQYPSGYRGIIYKTTNGGNNWGYQIPDTSFVINRYWFINFVNNLNGWAFFYSGKCIHTISGGGDTTFYTGICNNISSISKDYILYQNYPNPFNQFTIINVQCKMKSSIKLTVYDITGKEVAILVNETKIPGKYEVRFNGGNLSSGIYFYRLEIRDNESNLIFNETKKMIMMK